MAFLSVRGARHFQIWGVGNKNNALPAISAYIYYQTNVIFAGTDFRCMIKELACMLSHAQACLEGFFCKGVAKIANLLNRLTKWYQLLTIALCTGVFIIQDPAKQCTFSFEVVDMAIDLLY